MKRLALIALLLVTLIAGVCGAADAPPASKTPPTPDARRVLLVTIDGLRPDLALLADAPTIRSLMRAGCYSMWARTTDIAITLPSHTTLVTGVSPKVHGVTWNTDLKPGQHVYPNVPTIFELAKKAGMSTAIVAGKTKFDTLARPGSVDWLWLPNGEPFDDLTVADEAGKIIRDHRPKVMLLHFPFVDTVGHAQGWGSPQQLAAIAQADRALARVLVSLDAAGVRKNTLVILTADHGGCGKGHGGTKPLPRTDPASTAPADRVPDQASLHIPWIAAGGSVREGVDLTQYRELNVRIEDSFATACRFLGLPIPDNCEGKVVKELWEVPAPPAVRSPRDPDGVSLMPAAARLKSKTCIPASLGCSCCSIEGTSRTFNKMNESARSPMFALSCPLRQRQELCEWLRGNNVSLTRTFLTKDCLQPSGVLMHLTTGE